MTDNEERAYIEGSEAAWLSILRLAIKNVPAAERDANRWAIERAETVVALRRTCEAFGDLEWDENLHLADVVAKHLEDHLHAVAERERERAAQIVQEYGRSRIEGAMARDIAGKIREGGR